MALNFNSLTSGKEKGDFVLYQNKKTGKIVMKILIDICKKNGIKAIRLSDTAHLNCGKYSLDLKLIYTMIHGFPWYYRCGFKCEDLNDHKIIKDNYKLLKKYKGHIRTMGF